MADLSFANLDAVLPAASLTETVDDVTISLKTLMGETAVQLADEKVSEFVSKLLTSAAVAQAAYNETAPETLNSYPNPTPGVPQKDSAGNWFARFTHNIAVSVPLNVDETVASRS